jgi:hypothetical protein
MEFLTFIFLSELQSERQTERRAAAICRRSAFRAAARCREETMKKITKPYKHRVLSKV